MLVPCYQNLYVDIRYVDIPYFDIAYVNIRYVDIAYVDIAYVEIRYVDINHAVRFFLEKIHNTKAWQYWATVHNACRPTPIDQCHYECFLRSGI